LLFLMLPTVLVTAPARGMVTISEVQTFGWIADIVVDGDVAYLASTTNGQLLAVDISDPHRPSVLWSKLIGAYSLEMIGDTLILDAQFDELRIFDVSDPRSPVDRGTIAGSAGLSHPTYADGRLYAIGGGVHVFDASDPTSPVEIGHFPTPAGSDPPKGLAVRDGLAYLAMESIFYELVIVDFSDAAAPSVVGTWSPACCLAGEFSQLWLHGSRVHMPTSTARLFVVDVSDPSEPVEIGRLEDEKTVGAMAFPDGRVVMGRHYGLEVWDLDDPSEPTRLGAMRLPGEIRDVVVHDDLAFVANLRAGMRVVDLREPGFPRVRGGLELERPAGVAVQGIHAFVADAEELRVVDISDPDHPESVAGCEAQGTPFELELHRVSLDAGHVAVAGSHFEVFDVSDPLEPVSRAWLPLAGNDVALTADRVHLLDSGEHAPPPGALHLIELADPAAPQPIDSFETATDGLGPNRTEIQVVDGRAYVAIWETSFGPGSYYALDVLDVSGPAIQRIATPSLGVAPEALVIHPPFAFVAGGYLSGFQLDVLDLDDLGDELPVPIGALYASDVGPPRDLIPVGGVLYAATGGTVWAIDVRDPSRPLILGGVEVDAGQIARAGEQLVVTSARNLVTANPESLHVLEFGPQYQLAPEPNATLLTAAAFIAIALLRRPRASIHS
jgi:hypothetical protein